MDLIVPPEPFLQFCLMAEMPMRQGNMSESEINLFYKSMKLLQGYPSDGLRHSNNRAGRQALRGEKEMGLSRLRKAEGYF